MKKVFIFALILGLAAFAVTSHAQNYGFGNPGMMGNGNGGYGYGHGMGHGGWGHGGCWGNNGNWNGNGNYQNPEISIKSESDASKAVATYLAEENLKGYKLGDATAYNSPRGVNVYSVEATDASGNAFIFVVSPYGWVRGPMHDNR